MEENKEKQLDQFTRELISELGLETPPADFTDSVMSKIRSEAQSAATLVYRPLISKQVWGIVAILIIAIFYYAFTGSGGSEVDWLPSLDLNWAANFSLLRRFSNFAVSNTVLYGFLGLGFFVWVQVIILKRRFDKQFSID